MSNKSFEHLLNDVRRAMANDLRQTSLAPLAEDLRGVLSAGKMLRGRLILHLGPATGLSESTQVLTAVAVEMIHAASLLHDDVIDGAELRRGAPTFWITRGMSGAILLGDLLVCRTFRLLNAGCPQLVSPLLRFMEEMCDAETEQELLLRNSAPDWQKCVSLARRKTGSLFAFAGYACGQNDPDLCAALQEAGYAIGTAYQLADDILDAAGNQDVVNKTLGTDALNGKLTATLAWACPSSARETRPESLSGYVRDLCATAGQTLRPWPAVQEAWNTYMEQDMAPVIMTMTDLLPAAEAGTTRGHAKSVASAFIPRHAGWQATDSSRASREGTDS
ncbi:MAG: polyprenyl synthetase family protein, partial [Lentisphaerae bacterium]|nr:polyprenyl synthetase family protein [Lentisphaerota bacterium]